MTRKRQSESAPPAKYHGVDAIIDHTPRPSVYLTIGKRGSGKDATTAALLDEIAEKTGKPVYSPYDPVKFGLPKHWKPYSGGDAFKPHSIYDLSDFHLEMFARDWQSDYAGVFIKLVSISRHRDIDFGITTQMTRLIDALVVATIDCLILKEPSVLADRFERPELRDITAEAKAHFPEGQGKAEKLAKWERAYVLTDSYPPFLVDGIKKPSWYSDEMGTIYAEPGSAPSAEQPKSYRIF